jgi:hypothetical protein
MDGEGGSPAIAIASPTHAVGERHVSSMTLESRRKISYKEYGAYAIAGMKEESPRRWPL